MGLYREHVLPRLVDRACGTRELRRWREQVTAGLSGTVVEVGFGSGLNMPAYPGEVTMVYAVEPAATARRLAGRRIADAGIPVEHVSLHGESIPLDDATCDGALSTFTLCTIPEVERALAEIRRVVKPGGRFHFGVGVSHAPMNRRLGLQTGKPLSDMRDFVEGVRGTPRVGDLPPIVVAALPADHKTLKAIFSISPSRGNAFSSTSCPSSLHNLAASSTA